MWDYDKLFAEGNVIKTKDRNVFSNKTNIWAINNSQEKECLIKTYGNKELATNRFEIQYIIRLDEHGNVVEKLFDREVDMPKPMPELKTGMFVRVGKHKDNVLGFVDVENNHIIYQDGGYDFINSNGIWDSITSAIIEVYGKDSLGFSYCRNDSVIWRSPEYQNYLDSKN